MKKTIIKISNGNATAKMIINCLLIWRVNTIPSINILSDLINILIAIAIIVWTAVTSLVTLVTSEAVEKSSDCWKDKCIILLNKPFLKSLANFWLAKLANTPLRIPLTTPIKTNASIIIPLLTIVFKNWLLFEVGP